MRYICVIWLYRVIEKLNLIHIFNNGLISYIFSAITVVCGSIIFSVCAKWFINKIQSLIVNRRVNHV